MNAAAFAQLYDVHYPRVYHYLLWRLRDKRAAEQLVARVFTIAQSTLERGVRPEHAGSWLVATAERLAAGFASEQHAEKTSSQPGVTVGADSEEQDVERLEVETIRRCMDDLGEEYRRILLLRIIAGLSLREIGEIVGMTETAVLALQFRALAALDQHLKEVEQRADPHCVGTP